MRLFSSLTDPALISCLNDGGIVVLPTDTMYGLVARASDKQAVEKLYRLRGRAPQKPCVVLIAGRWQIADNKLWTPMHKALADQHWPGPLSLVAPTSKTEEYLHRGTHTLAYRVPAHEQLRKLLANTGPLIAPSANKEGERPATTIQEAQNYFNDQIDGYVDGGALAVNAPSTVAGVVDGEIYIFRQGILEM